MSFRCFNHCCHFQTAVTVRGVLVRLLVLIVTLNIVLPVEAGSDPSLWKQLDDYASGLEAPFAQLMLHLGEDIEHGSAQFNDQEYASRMYCVAARLGSTEAQFRLAKMLLEGRGVPVSLVNAGTLLSIAAASGHQGAAEMLARIGVQRIEVPRCFVTPVISGQKITP